MYPMECSKCLELKTREEFVSCKRSPKGHRTYCKKCHAAHMKQYYLDNPDKYLRHKVLVANNDSLPKYQEKRRPWNRHKISEEKYDELLGKFNGMCWVCLESVATVVDHDHQCCPKSHSCGKCVRGMLCAQCNTALGLLRDNPKTILRAAQYVVQYKEQ